LALYPHLHLLKDGRVFYSGMCSAAPDCAGFLNPATGAFAQLPPAALPHRSPWDAEPGRDRPAAPRKTQKVMVMGGGDPSLKDVHIVDTDAATVKYVAAPSNAARPRPCELGDPARSQLWSPPAAALVRRWPPRRRLKRRSSIPPPAPGPRALPHSYRGCNHSIALLLPDGRVLTGRQQPPAARRTSCGSRSITRRICSAAAPLHRASADHRAS